MFQLPISLANIFLIKLLFLKVKRVKRMMSILVRFFINGLEVTVCGKGGYRSYQLFSSSGLSVLIIP